jgi:uncharacterized protein
MPGPAPLPSQLITDQMFHALRDCNIEMVKKLLDDGCSVECFVGRDNQTPIMLACSSGSIDMVKLLLQYNCNVNALDTKDTSCGALAISKGFVEILELLISSGFNLLDQLDYQGLSPAFYAAQSGHSAILEILHAHGVDLMIPDGRGITPCIIAANMGRKHVLAWFEDKGFDMDYSCLLEAVESGLQVSGHPSYFKNNSPAAQCFHHYGVTNKMHVDTKNWLLKECRHCRKHGANSLCSLCNSTYYCK